ncbi:uncharacterized protein N0V89_000060 [Didymosphaeria variabile]|uniref:Uncharacterized protein n=1 Tax=Didymosphaeria variabile TaxID=1932322 RepID=A0A9W8XW33_9PLEO|nr:uncharacterized protein N0V89_000060 [Didymosphaeria variabile]KAJ4359505.1 hypothetical protein N0V89_000060 [Didymosphaeria variabile]
MSGLFRPPGADPLATRADTGPYVQNVCGCLSLSKAKMYRDFIKYFEDGVISEDTLASMIREGHMFDDNFYASILHDDLVLVILYNKLDESPEVKAAVEGAGGNITEIQQSLSSLGFATSAAVPGNAEHAGAALIKFDKMWTNVTKQPQNKMTLSLRPALAKESTAPSTSHNEAGKAKRVRNSVSSREKKTLAEEADTFLNEGK